VFFETPTLHTARRLVLGLPVWLMALDSLCGRINLDDSYPEDSPRRRRQEAGRTRLDDLARERRGGRRNGRKSPTLYRFPLLPYSRHISPMFLWTLRVGSIEGPFG
jgi:hypothetical protein